MFLRRIRKKANGEFYDYWALCESVRTPKGPRQRMVASLGKLGEEQAGAGWEDIEALLKGQDPVPRARQLELGEQPGEPQQDRARWEVAQVGALRVERTRQFGRVYLALALWKRLKLDDLLEHLLPEGRESVRWVDVASILTCARFCAQDSELKIAERWYESTALEDLLDVDAQAINDDRLYRALDVLLEHKDALCKHLMERYESWFGVNFEFLLYDVTSTYFEGQAEANEKAARGYSRDNRPDCKQVCIGLVCTPEGLPLCYEVFAGNRTDVTTVEEIVTQMESRFGRAQRIWVMDRGMVSEANLEFLRSRNARYLVGTPKAQLRHFEADLLEKEGWSEVQSHVEARLVEHPDGNGTEKFVLCRSLSRVNKERAMFERQMQALTRELLKIDQSLRKRPQKKLQPLERRIGRWMGRFPTAARVLQAEIIYDSQAQASGLSLFSDLSKGQSITRQQGAYLLRTNCEQTDPALIWRWYIQLTQAEAAFRTSKSDLGMRPIYHQKTNRVEAHILVCFLALALWRSLEMWMAAKGLGSNAAKLVEQISRIQSMDVVVPVKRDDAVVDLRVRTVARPDDATRNLLAHLGLRLPDRNKIIAM